MDGAAKDRFIPAERLLPQVIREDRDAVLSFGIFTGHESATDSRLRAQNRQESR
jgi:hypothetical protein